MPRNVRNFWLEAAIDGRGSSIATGPRRSDGGISVEVKMREEGYISAKRVTVVGAAVEGKLWLQVTGYEGNTQVWQHEIETKR